MPGGTLSFRCHIGHAYSEQSLAAALADSAGQALEVAIRVLDERIDLLRRMAERDRGARRRRSAEILERRTGELAPHLDTLRHLLEARAADAQEAEPAGGRRRASRRHDPRADRCRLPAGQSG